MSPTTRVMKSPKQPSRSADRVARATRSQTTSRSTVNSVISTATSSSFSTVRIATARKSSARRGRPLRGANTSTSTPGHAPETEADRVDDSVQVNTPATPESEPIHVQVVDLITPQPAIPVARAVRRPLEVDLTCDLDDEVFVVLEDIVNPSRRTDLPIRLGTSPPRSRVLPRNLRSTFGRQQENSVESELKICQSSKPEIVSKISTSAQEPSSHGIYCPVCLDSLSQVKEANHQMHSTTCGHVFCGPCITKCIVATKQCPTCRKDLNMSNIHPIFI